MSNAIVINTLEELEAFLNEKGVMEIAVRNQNKRFKAFQKVMISNPPETQEKELTEKVIHALNINKNTAMNERNLKLLGEIAKLEKIDAVGIGIGGRIDVEKGIINWGVKPVPHWFGLKVKEMTEKI